MSSNRCKRALHRFSRVAVSLLSVVGGMVLVVGKPATPAFAGHTGSATITTTSTVPRTTVDGVGTAGAISRSEWRHGHL